MLFLAFRAMPLVVVQVLLAAGVIDTHRLQVSVFVRAIHTSRHASGMTRASNPVAVFFVHRCPVGAVEGVSVPAAHALMPGRDGSLRRSRTAPHRISEGHAR